MVSEDALILELRFKAVRSSGSGGQHVNKVASKVELSFNLPKSEVLSDLQKKRLLNKLDHRLTKDQIFILQCDESRSQHRNKELVIKRFLDLIKDGLKVPKKRIPTKISKSAIRKRLKSKRQLSDKKANRRKPEVD